MKQELTIAVVLLAIGGLFWASGRSPDHEPLHAVVGSQFADSQNVLSKQQAAIVSAGQQQRLNSQQEFPVVPASYQQPIVDAGSELALPDLAFPANSPTTPINDSLPSPNSPSAVPKFSATAEYFHPTSNRGAVELLASAAIEIANSNPFQSKLAIWGQVFQQEIVASGNYYQMGQGSHKTKIELSFDQMPGKPQMLQLCDGRFVYTIHSDDSSAQSEAQAATSQQKLEFVDLLRVQEATGDDTANRGIVSPTGWVATGGIASLLQHLASGFNFGPPEALDPNSNRILIRGSWDENALRGIVSDLDNNIKLGSPIQWDQVPKHMPHAIEMVLVRSSNQAYFPHQISFLRFGVKDHQATIEPSVSMTFSPPEPLSNLADGFFVIDSSNLEPTDATDRYITRIKSLGRFQEKVATQQDPTADSSIK